MKSNIKKDIQNASLAVKKITVFDKIKIFLKKLFKNDNTINESVYIESSKINNSLKKENFQDNIKVQHDFEKDKLMNLKNQFDNNIITEKDMSEEERSELKGLYYIEMLKSKIRIDVYKEKIAKSQM